MELLTSAAICWLLYLVVAYWEDKARKERQKTQSKKFPSATRGRQMMIALVVFLGSCTSTRFLPTGQQQARLYSVRWLHHNTAALVLFTRDGDTVYFNDRQPSMQRRRYIAGDLYTIQYDSTKFQIIDGKKYLAAIIRHNQ